MQKAEEVLLVEDTLTQAMMIQHLLENHGFKTRIARNGQKALDYLSATEPQVIISDINMPEMDGFELCRLIKANEETRTIPFVLLVSFTESKDIINLIECGTDNILLKIFEAEYFVPRLRAIIDMGKRACGHLASVKLSMDGNELSMALDAQRVTDLLISAFDAAVYQNKHNEEVVVEA